MNKRQILTTVLLMALTGMQAQNKVREYWLDLLLRMCRPIYINLSEGTLRQNMPVETSDGLNTGNSRKEVTHLEALGRSFAGLSPWLSLPDDHSEESNTRRLWIELVVKAITNAVDPKSADYMPFNRPTKQPLVDAAYFAQGLLRSGNVIWSKLDKITQQRVIGELKSTRSIVPGEKNWLMFSAEIEVALLELTGKCDTMPIVHALKRHEEWYKGDGWYGDGSRLHMDYYNSYVIHPMLMDVVTVLNKHHHDSLRYRRELPRFIRMAEQQERLIAADGSYPIIGRSICYRTGAFHLLAQAAWLHFLPKTCKPAQVRSALTAVYKRVFVPDTFDKDGWMRLGVCGHQPSLADKYVSTGSLYMATLSFLPLGLPADDAFWKDADTDWTQKKCGAKAGKSDATRL